MKHPHAEVIKAWADGKTVQGRPPRTEWQDFTYNGDNYMTFDKNLEYRIKPEEVVDYGMIFHTGTTSSQYFQDKEKLLSYYVRETEYQGFLKRTTVDGKVVKMEFIPK